METREEIETTLNQHFKDIMSGPRQDRRGDIDQIMRFIPSLLSHEQNKLLMKAISLVEVKEIVFQMIEGKSLGANGFTVNLFHHFWALIKLEVWNIVEYSRVSTRILIAFNATFLTLIQNVKELILETNSGP